MNTKTTQPLSASRAWVPQVAVRRDLCGSTAEHRSRNTATCGTRKQHNAAKLIALTIVAGMGTLLTGCSSTSASAGDAGTTKRILICQTRPEFKEKVIEAAKELSKIPGTVDVFIGSPDSQQTPPKWLVPGDNRLLVILTLSSDDAIEKLKNDADYNYFLKQVNFYAADLNGEIIKELTFSRVDYSLAKDFVEKNTAADLQRRAAAVEKMEQQRSRTK